MTGADPRGRPRPLIPAWAVVALPLLVVGAAIVIAVLVFARPGAAPNPDATAASERSIAWFGDSITAGAPGGATVNTTRYTAIVSEELGYAERNYAQPGTTWTGSIEAEWAPSACGFDYCRSFREMIHVAAADGPAPDIIVVSGGRNAAHLTAEQLEGEIRGFFKGLREAFPDTEILATGAIWGAEEAPGIIPQMSRIIEEEVTAVGGRYLDIGQPLAGHPEWVPVDGVHPDDDGHRAIAEAVLAAWNAQ